MGIVFNGTSYLGIAQNEDFQQLIIEGLQKYGNNYGGPQQWEGRRMDPARSEPISKGVIPVAIAAAAPPDDPPGVRAGFHGFTVSG